MCGIAGVLDLKGVSEPDRALVGRMATALRHRGPDGVGYLMAPGIGMGNRRLAIVGVTNGQQPIFNETGSVGVIANGELFDYPELKAELRAKGHVFSSDSDTELIVHLYEEHGEALFEHLKGQFAFVLVDFARGLVLLARDRAGICPLHWSRQGDRLYFGSEIKALFASGAVRPAIDPRGLDHIFTFFAMGSQRTMFAGVQSLRPGHYLRIAFRNDGTASEIEQRCYWDLDFPDWGDEDDPADEDALVDEFEAVFSRAVEIRLRAEVPVVGYLSGGVDSAYVLATASRLRGKPLPSFTVRVPEAQFDETSLSMGTVAETAKLTGSFNAPLEESY
jgi:asparagine synthase (glutamine-hydrolysing)